MNDHTKLIFIALHAHTQAAFLPFEGDAGMTPCECGAYLADWETHLAGEIEALLFPPLPPPAWTFGDLKVEQLTLS